MSDVGSHPMESDTARRQPAPAPRGENRRLGAEAADILLTEGIEAADRLQDRFHVDFAHGFVERLSAGMKEDRASRGWVRNVMDGAGRVARNLNVEPEHG